MTTPIPEDKSALIEDAIFRGQKIEAIKLYRECTKEGLAESKDAVEKLEAQLRINSPLKFTAPPSGKGCAGVLAMVCAIVVAVVLCIVSK